MRANLALTEPASKPREYFMFFAVILSQDIGFVYTNLAEPTHKFVYDAI
ncbi:MAG: hypothetical protein GY845_00170 [Planctomycetes bacterium]|nr:hypothetical protein [Planctomycetota bacterium]